MRRLAQPVVLTALVAITTIIGGLAWTSNADLVPSTYVYDLGEQTAPTIGATRAEVPNDQASLGLESHREGPGHRYDDHADLARTSARLGGHCSAPHGWRSRGTAARGGDI